MKSIFFFLLLTMGWNIAISQQVVRKGVTPVIKKKTTPVTFYNTGQLNGKWQEVLRTNPGSSVAVNFNDTLLMNFNRNKVEIRDGISMNMKGDAGIDQPNILNAAGDVYTIKSISGNTMVLDDGDYVHRMQRTRQFYYEMLGKDSLFTEKYESPVTIELKDLPGKWVVYRRQAGPGKVSGENLIKSIQINSFNSVDSIKGEVVIYNADITRSFPAIFLFNNGVMTIITDNKTWNFNTYKANGKEFVFGNSQLLYYTKPL